MVFWQRFSGLRLGVLVLQIGRDDWLEKVVEMTGDWATNDDPVELLTRSSYDLLRIFFVECASDHHSSDLACPRPDLVQFRVSEEAASRYLVDVSVTA